MPLTQRLEIRQSQALVMTPQLMQAIKLLQLSNLDLATYVEGEIERNPLLDRAAEAEGDGEQNPSEREPASAAGIAAAEWMRGGGSESGAREARAAPELGSSTALESDAVSSRVFIDNSRPHSDWTCGGLHRRDSAYNLEAFVSEEAKLADHLAEQLALAVSDPARRMIGQYLIDLVDEAGYLTEDLAQVAEKLGAAPAEIEAVLVILQSFEPLGVCARSLPECLSIQLKERDRFDPAMQALVTHLDLLAKRDLAALRKTCGVTDEDLGDMITEIRQLNPKPGLAFGTTLVQPIVPDVFVRQGPDGGFLVELNSETLPKVLINQAYYAQITGTVKGE